MKNPKVLAEAARASSKPAYHILYEALHKIAALPVPSGKSYGGATAKEAILLARKAVQP